MIIESVINSVVLGCKELRLLFYGVTLLIPYLDTLEIHADAIAYNPEQEIGCENKKLFFIR